MIDPLAVFELGVGHSLVFHQAHTLTQAKRRRVAADDAGPQPGRAGFLEREINHLGERGIADSATLGARFHENPQLGRRGIVPIAFHGNVADRGSTGFDDEVVSASDDALELSVAFARGGVAVPPAPVQSAVARLV